MCRRWWAGDQTSDVYLGGPLGAMTGLPLGVLMAPLAVQEMALAARLVVKGFDRPVDRARVDMARELLQVAGSAA